MDKILAAAKSIAAARRGRNPLAALPADLVPADEAGPAGGSSSTGGANLDHLCLRVEPFDAAEIARHLAGQSIACGAETLRYGAEGEGPSIYLRDPEDNGIELKGPPTDR